MLFVRCRDASLGSTTLNYALGLETSFKALAEALNKTSAFTASTKFEGIIGLATEVPAKKVCCLFGTYVHAKLASLFDEYQYVIMHMHARTAHLPVYFRIDTACVLFESRAELPVEHIFAYEC